MDEGEGSLLSASLSTSLNPPELLYQLGPHLELGTSFSPAGVGRPPPPAPHHPAWHSPAWPTWGPGPQR